MTFLGAAKRLRDIKDSTEDLVSYINDQQKLIELLQDQLQKEQTRCKLAQGSVELAYKHVLGQLLDCTQQRVKTVLLEQTTPVLTLRPLGQFQVGDKVVHKRYRDWRGEVTKVADKLAHVRRITPASIVTHLMPFDQLELDLTDPNR